MAYKTLAEYNSAYTKRTLSLDWFTALGQFLPEQQRIKLVIGNTRPLERVGIDLKSEDAVDLAKRILRELQPDALAPAPFRETVQAGQFFRNKNNGQIVKIAEYDSALFPARSGPDALDEHEAFAVKDDGKGMVIVQRPANPVWVALDGDQVTEKVSWEFNPNA